MSGWSDSELATIGRADEIHIAPDRADHTPGPSVTIWVVRVGDDLYVRSYRGPSGSWYRRARAQRQRTDPCRRRRPCGPVHRGRSHRPNAGRGGLPHQVWPVPQQLRPADDLRHRRRDHPPAATHDFLKSQISDDGHHALRSGRRPGRVPPQSDDLEATDVIIRIAAACVCGSGLRDYRGINPVPEPKPMGHEYCGTVEEVGAEVTTIKPGDFVIGSFVASDTAARSARPATTRSIPARSST
jgi:hypothetical protein